MPKDIRAYFSTSFKSQKTVKNDTNTNINGNRKRKKIILISDSDEESSVNSPKKEKKHKIEKKILKDTSSKYFEVDKETVKTLIGSTAIKRKNAPPICVSELSPKKKNTEINDLVRSCIDDDDDNDSGWLSNFASSNSQVTSKDSGCVSDYASSSSQSRSIESISPQSLLKCTESNSEKENHSIDIKKRKLNYNNGNTENEIDIKRNTSSVSFNNLISNDSIKEKAKDEIEKKNTKKTSPKKLASPKKLVSPKKNGSPQKTLTSYFSSPEKTPPKFNKLDIAITSKSPRNNEKKLTVSPKNSKEKFKNNKKSPRISPKKIDLTKHVEHDLSSENSDDEFIVKKKVDRSFKKVLQNIPAEHTLSPSSSEDEIKLVKIIRPQISQEKSATTKKCIEKQSAIVKNSEAFKNSIKPVTGPKFELWVDKYRPLTLKNVIGQQGEKSNVNKLVKWLKNWFENHNGKKKIARPSPWAKDDSGAYFKAALLSGPPGVGKTTTAHLVCKELNMDVVEFNASDTRSKKLLHQEISELLSSKTLSPYLQGGNSTSRQHVLVMDEVDGMAGNEDRGGIQELISLIKNTKIPIICMCNDRNHPKIRSLVNYCFDLRFNRPRVEQIKGSMLSICFKEKLKIKPDLLVQIITSTNQDIRLILNHLSMLAAKKEESMNLTSKEIKMGAWDVLRKVFSNEEHKKMTIHDKCDLFFHDYSIAPLFVHENYLNVLPYSEKGKTKQGKIDLFAKASNSLCYGDMIEQAIRTNSAWSLLPTQAVFSSLIPGEILSGRVGGMINFPTWFGKNSKKNKFDRLSQEIQMHTRLKISASKEAICTDYSYRLRDGISSPLINFGSDGIESSLQFVHDYNLLREDIESLTELTSWPNTKDPFSSLDSKLKAAFTRAYNKHPVMTPFSVSGVTGFKKGRKGNSEENELDMPAVGEELTEESKIESGGIGSDEEQEDDLLTDGMITIKNKDKKETKSSSKGKVGKKNGKK